MQEELHGRERRWVDRDLGGRLPARLRPRLHDHLRSCAACRAYHDAAIEAFRVLEAEARVSGAEVAQVGEWLGLSPDPRPEPRRWLVPLVVAASLGAAAAIAVLARPSRAPGPAISPPALTAQAPRPAPMAALVPAAPAARAPDEILLRHDFEDGRALGWSAGTVSKGPPRAGSLAALAGVEYNQGRNASLGVRLESSNGLFGYDEHLEVRFTYWLGQTVHSLPYVEVSFREREARFEYVARLPRLPGGVWQEARVRLSDARPYGPSRRHVRPAAGAVIDLLKIKTSVRHEDVFFVDDVSVVRSR